MCYTSVCFRDGPSAMLQRGRCHSRHGCTGVSRRLGKTTRRSARDFRSELRRKRRFPWPRPFPAFLGGHPPRPRPSWWPRPSWFPRPSRFFRLRADTTSAHAPCPDLEAAGPGAHVFSVSVSVAGMGSRELAESLSPGEATQSGARPADRHGLLKHSREFLDFFWDIAKPEQETRLAATEKLLEYLRGRPKVEWRGLGQGPRISRQGSGGGPGIWDGGHMVANLYAKVRGGVHLVSPLNTRVAWFCRGPR